MRRLGKPRTRSSRTGCRPAALRCLGAFAMTLAALLLATVTARADSSDFESAIHSLAEPSPEEVSRGISGLGSCGDPRAMGVLEALRDGNLLVAEGGTIYLKDAGGALHDAISGAPSGSRAGRAPPVDNEVRRVLLPVLARLELRSPDRAVRLAANETLADRGN